MIEASHSVVIDAPIDRTWDYVKDIRRWATLFPGCQECTVIDDHDSRWTLKVGAGGLIKTVNVLVNVGQWDGPERVDFTFKLENEPVTGKGTYSAARCGPGQTDVALSVAVSGVGPMAPMWEAVSKPLLPHMAKVFAGKLKTAIESPAGVGATERPRARSTWIAAVRAWIVSLRRALFDQPPPATTARENSTVNIDTAAKNKVVVRTFVEAMSAADSAKAATCLAPDARTIAKGYGKFAGVREYNTIVGTIAAFKTLLPTGLRVEFKSITAEEDRVVAEFEGNGTTCDGKSYANQYCMVFMLSGGKIKQVNEYFCTKLADDVLWPLVEAMASEIPATPAEQSVP